MYTRTERGRLTVNTFINQNVPESLCSTDGPSPGASSQTPVSADVGLVNGQTMTTTTAAAVAVAVNTELAAGSSPGEQQQQQQQQQQQPSPLTSPLLMEAGYVRTDDEDEARRKKFPTDKAYFLAKELLTTERTYLKDLHVVTTSFQEVVGKEEVLPEKVRNLIAANYEPLLKFHQGFLREVEQRLAQWEGRSNAHIKGDYQRIGDILLNNIQGLKVTLSRRPATLPLNVFLLRPLHRLLHYRLLLERLCKHYPPTHQDFRDSRGTAAHVRGEFIRLGCLSKLSGKGLQQRMFFLFSDCLVYTSRGMTPANQFKVHGQLPLYGMTVRESEDEWGVPHSFTLFGQRPPVTSDPDADLLSTSLADKLQDEGIGEQESEEELAGSRSSLERPGHRGNTTKACYLPLNVFLLRPLHRLLHYRLLLERLCKHYPPTHQDFRDSRGTAAHVRGEFIRLGCLSKLSGKGLQQRMFFLVRESEDEWGVPHSFTLFGQRPPVVVAARPATLTLTSSPPALPTSSRTRGSGSRNRRRSWPAPDPPWSAPVTAATPPCTSAGIATPACPWWTSALPLRCVCVCVCVCVFCPVVWFVLFHNLKGVEKRILTSFSLSLSLPLPLPLPLSLSLSPSLPLPPL
ncbi:hypothetical protein CRUP_003242 [Coryphaenoides rupestris]|nr:hypothetical protein CRUP_003242 [Coryphaenoides rupestris]